ncbi:hypothetical protein GCM10020254_88440 [Streptomyces goshikiensis]
MSAHEMKQRMEEILAARKEAIGPLLEVQGQRADLLKQLALLDKPYSEAYATAEAGGVGAWTSWRPLGAEEPAKRPKPRSRARRASTAKGTEPTASSPAAVPAQDSTGSAAPLGADAQPG